MSLWKRFPTDPSWISQQHFGSVPTTDRQVSVIWAGGLDDGFSLPKPVFVKSSTHTSTILSEDAGAARCSATQGEKV